MNDSKDHKAAAEPPLDCRVMPSKLDQAKFEALADAPAPLMREPEYTPTFAPGYEPALTEARVRQIVREELARLQVPNAELDRVAKLRADLDYVAAYLESAVEGERESGLLMSGKCLLADVLEFLARDNAERANAEITGRTLAQNEADGA